MDDKIQSVNQSANPDDKLLFSPPFEDNKQRIRVD